MVAVSASAGRDASLALLADGTVMAWGSNNGGLLGNGTNTDVLLESLTPLPVKGPGSAGSLDGIVALSAAGDHNLAVSTGAAYR